MDPGAPPPQLSPLGEDLSQPSQYYLPGSGMDHFGNVSAANMPGVAPPSQPAAQPQMPDFSQGIPGNVGIPGYNEFLQQAGQFLQEPGAMDWAAGQLQRFDPGPRPPFFGQSNSEGQPLDWYTGKSVWEGGLVPGQNTARNSWSGQEFHLDQQGRPSQNPVIRSSADAMRYATDPHDYTLPTRMFFEPTTLTLPGGDPNMGPRQMTIQPDWVRALMKLPLKGQG